MLPRSYKISRILVKFAKLAGFYGAKPHIFGSNNKYDKALLILTQNLKQFISEQTFHDNTPFRNTIKNFFVFLYIVFS